MVAPQRMLRWMQTAPANRVSAVFQPCGGAVPKKVGSPSCVDQARRVQYRAVWATQGNPMCLGGCQMYVCEQTSLRRLCRQSYQCPDGTRFEQSCHNTETIPQRCEWGSGDLGFGGLGDCTCCVTTSFVTGHFDRVRRRWETDGDPLGGLQRYFPPSRGPVIR